VQKKIGGPLIFNHLITTPLGKLSTPSPHFIKLGQFLMVKKKTVLIDAWNGYHSVPLHPDDRHYTTFITPWSRYRYCTAPQGYIASGDGYSRYYDEVVVSIPQKTKCVDDTLLWSDTIHDCFLQAAQWLDICARNGITHNPDKFVFAQDNVNLLVLKLRKTQYALA